ncbi:NUDIX hydrolase [Thalassovita sp.]|uniref:NUDIX hydrolase n=1 Tax=Thalassovita sp. TaxID=1979401 RepID=UPI0029DE6B75|nr:NUDIX hydrolase [Thalassovita sp.]
MIRRFGQPPRHGQKYIHRPGAYALLPLDGSLLLTHQSEPWPEYQLPGGGIDAGESPTAALHREVYEETGWTISRPRRLGAFRRFTFMPEYDIWAEKLCTIYIAQPVRQIADPSEPGHTALWMPLHRAADLLGNSGDRHFADLLLNGHWG